MGVETRYQSYKPWGELRGSGNSLPTDRTYTGQRWSESIGLSFYNARWLDSALGRFTSPDTTIPSAGYSGDWDRYVAMRNNPVKYLDPSGYNPECGPDGMFCDPSFKLSNLYTCKNCLGMDKKSVGGAVKAVANSFGSLMRLSAAAAFWSVYGEVVFERVSSYTYQGIEYDSGAVTLSANWIQFASLEWEGQPGEANQLLRGTNHILHELGHAFAKTALGKDAYSSLAKDMTNDPLLGRKDPEVGYSYGFASGFQFYRYQFADSNPSSSNEIFADMFVGHVTGIWYSGSFPEGWGDNNMPNPQLHVSMAETKSDWISSYMQHKFGK